MALPILIISAIAAALAPIPFTDSAIRKSLISLLEKENNVLNSNFTNEVLSTLPKNFKSVSVTQAAEILDVAAESIRRKLRFRSEREGIPVGPPKGVANKIGYKIDIEELLSLSKLFSKETNLAYYLVKEYPDSYIDIAIKYNNEYINSMEKLKTYQKSIQDESLSNSLNSSNSYTKKEFLNLSLKSNELDIENINQKIDATSDPNEKIELLKKILELKEKNLNIQKELNLLSNNK